MRDALGIAGDPHFDSADLHPHADLFFTQLQFAVVFGRDAAHLRCIVARLPLLFDRLAPLVEDPFLDGVDDLAAAPSFS